MGTRKMSIQEALGELSLLTNRINRALSERNQYVAVVIGENTVRGFDSNHKFEEKAKAAFQSIKDLIKRRTLIKNAVIKKNAEVEVDIAGVKMTLAEAINQKTYIEADKEFLNQLTHQYNQMMTQLQKAENHYQEQLQGHIENSVSKDGKDKMEANKAIFKYFELMNKPKFIDPISISDTIEKMNKEIGEFEAKVDLAITKANITNDIEFKDPGYEESTN